MTAMSRRSPDPPESGHPAPIQVVFALLPGSLVLDWAGPAEALEFANRALAARGSPPAFALRFVGPRSEPRTSVGACVASVEALPDALPEGTWLVLVGMPGHTLDVRTPAARQLLAWLRRLRPGRAGLRLVTICAGAVIAAHAGLLQGRSATTHHHHLDELREAEPLCQVVPNRVFVEDGEVWSSAGVTTGIDLALHLIGRTCGPALAATVAQSMVVAVRRGPQDAEMSPWLSHRDHIHPGVHKVQEAVSAEPQADWSLVAMAALACTSPRHLTRLFVEHAGIAPKQYLQGLRLACAERALRSGETVTQAALSAGFGSDTALRRAWHQAGRPGTPGRNETAVSGRAAARSGAP